MKDEKSIPFSETRSAEPTLGQLVLRGLGVTILYKGLMTHKITWVFRTQHGSTVVIEKHVCGQGSFYFVSIDIFRWGFLLVFTFVALLGLFSFGGLSFSSSQGSQRFLGNFSSLVISLLLLMFCTFSLLCVG
jgi:hypothetical protein